MQVTPTPNSSTTPLRQPSIFSRSSSNAAGASSSRLSLHLHSSLLHTPPNRAIRPPAGTTTNAITTTTTTTTTTTAAMATRGGSEGATPPLLPTAEMYSFSPHSLRLERQHSSRHGITARSEEDTLTTTAAELERMEAEAAAAAEGMTREELETAVNELYTSNRMLQSTILLEREDLAKMREGLRETYEAAEKEGESITNQLTRRVDAVRRQKAELEAQLHKEEALKAEQEEKLVKLKLNSSNLARRLQREEEETLTRMKRELQQLQKQRQQLESLLSEESSSLLQLQEFVDALQPQTDDGTVGRSGSVASSNASNDNNNNNNNNSPAVAQSSNKDKGSVPDAAGSLLSDTPPSPQCRAPEYTDPASDPEEMLQYLKHEVSVVETLQREAYERGKRYEQKRLELERRISQAERERRCNRHSLEGIHQELVETTATVTELASAAEMAMEVEIDRQIHERSRTGSVASGSHECLSPPINRTQTPSEASVGTAQQSACQHARTNSSSSCKK